MFTQTLTRKTLGVGVALTFGFALSPSVAPAAASAFRVGTGHGALYPYRLIDLGTLGGPQADVGNGPYMNQDGVVAGTADLGVVDPYTPNDASAFNGDAYVQHAFTWSNGALTGRSALGPHPADNSSYPNGINARGDLAGISDNGTLDPRVGTIETRAVLWQSGQIIDLGTLGGNESQAFALNDRDQVVGVAANAVSDPVSMFGWGTQTRAFLWQEGRMHDLGTLGGPDAFGWFVNDSGQVAGVSYTSATVNPATGQPPIDLFLWGKGEMRDLGTLGGSVPVFGGVTALNNQGEVVGQSDLAGDQTAHPYLWNGKEMIDLGTLGGTNGIANAITEAGAVVGTADLADQTHHGFLWERGVMHDLRPLSGHMCSNADGINAANLVVGNETNCQGGDVSALLWNHGIAVDLNSLVAPSALHLAGGIAINDRGEIVGEGVLPNGNTHNFLLVPNDPDRSDSRIVDAPAGGVNESLPSDSEGSAALALGFAARQAHNVAGGFPCATGIRRVASGAPVRRRAAC